MRFGWTTIAQQVNQMLALGAKIVFAIDGTSTRCSFMIWCGSQPASVVCHGSATSSRQDQSHCGLQPYLMPIISEAEHEFVKSRIFDRFGAWQNGWIGASRNELMEWRWLGRAERTIKRCSGSATVLVRCVIASRGRP